MTLTSLCILILAIAVLPGVGRTIFSLRQRKVQQRARAWRVLALVLLPLASALLLYFVLFPPPTLTSAERLVILTANADVNPLKLAGRVLALPEAPPLANAELVPDLASALRRYPGGQHLQILGAGLSARDQDAASGLSVEFSPSPLPSGFIELSQPERVSPGARWQLTGRVAHIKNARVELVDPGNAVVASTQIDPSVYFILADIARTPGFARYQLRVLDDQKHVVGTLDVPMNIVQDAALKIGSLSGGPNPELKYLRRWALDAGVQLQSQISLSPGVQMANAPMAINANQLRDLDLLILDDRAWNTLPRNSKQIVIEALRGGLGVLLRLTGPLTSSDRSELQALGFSVEDANIVQGVHLENVTDQKTPASFTRRPLHVSGQDAVTLLRDNANNPLALWRAVGRGRMGLFWLTDSYQLVLSGDASRHGQIWRDTVSTLTRARAASLPFLRNRNVWVNERVVVCNIAAKTYVQAPDSEMTYLSVAASGPNRNCAAYWPRTIGWHVVVSESQEASFYVRAANEAPGLKLNALREATMLLASQHSTEKNSARIPVPGSPWPWFFAWLFVTTALWALERSKRGLRDAL